MIHAFEDGVIASSAASALVFAGWLSVGIRPVMPMLAQMVTAPSPAYVMSQESLFEFAIRQGGAFAILLIVLWFYRRDYRDLVAFRTERDKILVDLVKEQTAANSTMADALRENNIIVHQTKNVLREYIPARRVEDAREATT